MGQVGEEWDDWDAFDIESWERQEDERALSPAGIAAQNDHLLRRYRVSATPPTPWPRRGGIGPRCWP